MLKKATFLILLLISLICSIALTRTYSKYLLSKNIAGTISVPEVDYCIKQGITNLSDCMLVMENYSTDVDSAKIYISSKGIPDFSKTAPITNNIEYTEEVVKSSGVYSSSYNYTIAPSYTFDASTGVFTLNNYKMDI